MSLEDLQRRISGGLQIEAAPAPAHALAPSGRPAGPGSLVVQAVIPAPDLDADPLVLAQEIGRQIVVLAYSIAGRGEPQFEDALAEDMAGAETEEAAGTITVGAS